MEDAQSDCIVSQILEYMIELQGDVDRQNQEVQDLLGRLIISKYKIRQEKENTLVSEYESKLRDLSVLIEQLENKLKNIEDENHVKFEILDTLLPDN